ncbi:Uu.00g135950.m01.CDS01 [Anthostomella pinea]|uniref:Uu.00g135950.m01.CDS01 n=1 Tax=Anthostomella pinea TaxID=933095 RepID=A0AAI8YL32_9PEZI|nr:Uu.00g135950.m01.CDS01 [Anthostomella pinea]
MFGGLANLVQPPVIGPPPKNVPPPTPLRLPQCNPQLSPPSETSSHGTAGHTDRTSEPSIVRFLQSLHRPADVNESHFNAVGVHVHSDAPPEDVIPDPSYLPSASDWDGIDQDEARKRDQSFRRPLSNGSLSPEGRIYLERRKELSIPNQAAFRTVRRIKPEPGKQPPRLGSCFEFFKQMELMCSFWDDTSLPPLPEDDGDDDQGNEAVPPLPSRTHPIDGSLDQVGHSVIAAAAESNTRSEPESESKVDSPERVTYRTAPGSQMPPEYRHAMVAAFVKLVTYDFGCTVAPPRVEPRLHLTGSPPSKETSTSKSKPAPSQSQRSSYFPSGCVFLFRTPKTRDAARSGILEGPVAAVSARNTTSFSTPVDSNVDFGRELIAALVTAQHRARENKAEKRIGEGKWWTTAKRWGGGEGGPIGREVEGDTVVGDKDAATSPTDTAPSEGIAAAAGQAASTEKPSAQTKPKALAVRGPPLTKKPRKNLSMYDNYRMIRPPSSNWDKKVRYEAIGRTHGAGYDDVFVLSSLFHHLCVLRVRVPHRLLQVLDGGSDKEGEEGEGEGHEPDERCWGRLEMWRSRWFDLFVVEERLEALRLLWGMMAWAMRKGEDQGEDQGEDVAMKNA